MQEAYHAIRKLLDESPQDVQLKLKAAEAAVAVMRIVGNANSLTCKLGRRGAPEVEKQDTPENMKLWSEWVPLAQELLREVEQQCGSDAFCKDPAGFLLSVETNMYATSSRGIAAAVLSGKAVSFLASVSRLESLHPSFDSAIYCTYWGAYYLAAPWPVASVSKARDYFERAVEAFPHSRRNQYFAGVGAFADGDFDRAQAAMTRALQEECPSSSERDICDFMTREAQRTLTLLAGKTS